MTRKLLLLSAAGLSVAAATAVWAWQGSTESMLKKACLIVLEGRLRSPSTLDVRKWSDLERRPATKDEYVGPPPVQAHYQEEDWESVLKLHKDMETLYEMGQPDILLLSIDYEAANAFGTPVRGLVECSYFVNGDEAPDSISETSVRIDGKTQLQWSVEQLIQLKQ